MILVCGEALIDLIPFPHEQEICYAPWPGGSPANVAVALGRLEISVAFLGKISQDFFGEKLHSHLSSNGVDVRLVQKGPEPTTLALVHPGDGEPAFSIYAGGTSALALTSDGLPSKIPDNVRAIHVGSISLLIDPIATVLETFVEQQRQGRLVTIDPNIRPGLISEREKAVERLERWIGRADIVKTSAADVAWIYPESNARTVAQRWLDEGAALVVVSMGEQGAEAMTARGSVEVDAVPVDVIDTVGAGDALMAGLLAALNNKGFLQRDALKDIQPNDLRASLVFACRVAAYTCGRAGADPPRLMDLRSR